MNDGVAHRKIEPDDPQAKRALSSENHGPYTCVASPTAGVLGLATHPDRKGGLWQLLYADAPFLLGIRAPS